MSLTLCHPIFEIKKESEYMYLNLQVLALKSDLLIKNVRLVSELIEACYY